MSALMSEMFPPIMWVVEELLPEGLTILSGRPKLGKSWLGLDLCISVSTGRDFLGRATKKGDVLYLALEDSMRRLQDRIFALGYLVDGATDRLTLQTSIPRQDDGGTQVLTDWIKSHAEARLIVIDTLAKFRAPGNFNLNAYERDYPVMADLQKIALVHKIAIMLVTHERKLSADDYLITVSGSSGISGAADTIMVLRRNRNEDVGVLLVTGRDVEEQELTLCREGPRWLTKDPNTTQNNDTKQEIFDLIKRTFEVGSLFGSSEIVIEGIAPRTIRDNLNKLVHEGKIKRRGATHGARYFL